MISDRAAIVIISVVTGVWVTNIAVGMLQLNGYQASTELNGIFMGVVGVAVASRFKNSDKK